MKEGRIERNMYVCLYQHLYVVMQYIHSSPPLSSDQYTMDEEESGRWGSHISAEPSLSTIRSPPMEVGIDNNTTYTYIYMYTASIIYYYTQCSIVVVCHHVTVPFTNVILPLISSKNLCLSLQAVSAASLPEIEARIQQELEQKMKRDFEEKERRLQEEHLRKLEREKQEKEEQLR